MEEYSDAVVVRRIVSLVVLISICAHSAESVVLARADAAEAHVGTDATACLDVRRVEARGDVCPSDMMERLGPAFPFVHLQADSHRRVRLAQALPRCFSAIYNAAAAMQGSLQLQASSELWSRALRVWEAAGASTGPDGEEVGSQALAEGWYHAAVVKHSLGHDSDAIDAVIAFVRSFCVSQQTARPLPFALSTVPAQITYSMSCTRARLRLLSRIDSPILYLFWTPGAALDYARACRAEGMVSSRSDFAWRPCSWCVMGNSCPARCSPPHAPRPTWG